MCGSIILLSHMHSRELDLRFITVGHKEVASTGHVMLIDEVAFLQYLNHVISLSFLFAAALFQASGASMMNRLWAGLPRNSYSIPSTFKYFRLLKSMQTNSGSHSTVISIGNWSCFGGVNNPGRGTVCSTEFTAEAKNEWTSISSMHPNGQIYL